MAVRTDHPTLTRDARNALSTTLGAWKKGVTSLTAPFSSLPSVGSIPRFDATDAVERYFGLVRQIVDLNYDYARSAAGVTNELTGLIRKPFASVGSAVRDRVENVADVAGRTVDKVEQAAAEQAERAEEAERQARRDAAKAQRERQQKARDNARARYQDLKKTELAEQLASRELPKSGNVDELVERLVDDDTK